MIIRCDNCSVSLQLDESKVPSKNFTVRCPRCRNLIRTTENDKNASTVEQLTSNKPAPALNEGAEAFAAKEADGQINDAMRTLLAALQSNNQSLNIDDDDDDNKTRRILLCMGQHRDMVAEILVNAGNKVYLAKTPAQANERLREGKTEVLIFTPDFAAEFGGASLLHQKVNAMYASERRRLFLALIEDGATTMNAHDAFLRNLNLVVSTADIEQLPLVLNRSLSDFNDLYRYYNKAVGAEDI